jgi:hypothetical protein
LAVQIGKESAVNFFIYPFSLFLSMLNVEKSVDGERSLAMDDTVAFLIILYENLLNDRKKTTVYY